MTLVSDPEKFNIFTPDQVCLAQAAISAYLEQPYASDRHTAPDMKQLDDIAASTLGTTCLLEIGHERARNFQAELWGAGAPLHAGSVGLSLGDHKAVLYHALKKRQVLAS